MPGAQQEPAAAAGPTNKTVGLVYSDLMERHAAPLNHPEQPERHACVVARFQAAGLDSRCVPLTPRLAQDSELLRCHSAEHIRAVYALYNPSLESTEPVQRCSRPEDEIFFSKHTGMAARMSAGCCIAATLAVATGQVQRSFAVIRPPGHHAECERAMGFCFFNNCSLAALAALTQPGIERVLVLDWDVHHGNGVESMHYDDPRVLYISLHRYTGGTQHITPEWFYPGTGAVGDCGKGKGLGFNVNIPFREKGLGDADYAAAFDLAVTPIAREFAPSLVIIAAGFDAAEGDPLGQMCLTPGAYHRMAASLVATAARGRVVAALEGGYNLSATAASAEATLRALLGEPAPALPDGARPRGSTEAVLRAVAEQQGQYWAAMRGEECEARFRGLLGQAQQGDDGGGAAAALPDTMAGLSIGDGDGNTKDMEKAKLAQNGLEREE